MIRTHEHISGSDDAHDRDPPKDGSSEPNADLRPSKRLRTACDRCKGRKQRCDSLLPACSNCMKANAVCTFPFTNNPRYEDTASSHEYIRNLEERLASLERKQAAENRVDTHANERPRSAVRNGSLPLSPLSSAGIAQVVAQHVPQPGQEAPPMAPLAGMREGLQTMNPQNHTLANMANAVGFLSMGADSEPFFVGSTSGFSIATLVQAMLTVQPEKGPETPGSQPAHDVPRQTLSPVKPPEGELGDKIVATYFDRLHGRYPILDRTLILETHKNRSKLSPTEPAKSDGEADLRFKMYMVYALGSRIMQMMGSYDTVGEHPPESYYETALRSFPHVPKLASINFIASLALMTMWTIRMPKGAGLWHMIGLAMRSCLDLGMHREGYYRLIEGELERQMRRRLWWTIYSLERTVAGILGRPYMIREKEIDAELPADIDDDVTDPEAIRQAIENPRTPDQPSSTLSVGLHLFRFRQIESKIHRAFYTTLNRSPIDLLPKIQPYLTTLESWKALIPRPTMRHMSNASWVPPPANTSPDQYSLLFYYKAVRLLTQPFLGVVSADSQEFKACLHASGKICQIFKALHQREPFTYSFVSLQYVFISGITMLYCLWISRDHAWTFEVANDLRACSAVLFVICEHQPSARFYRDAFESLVTATTNYLSSPLYAPRGEKLRDVELRGATWEGIRDTDTSEDLWNMICDMTGADLGSVFNGLGDDKGFGSVGVGSAGFNGVTSYVPTMTGPSIGMPTVGAGVSDGYLDMSGGVNGFSSGLSGMSMGMGSVEGLGSYEWP